VCLSLLIPPGAQAAQCGGHFRAFSNAISGEAVKAGLSAAIVAHALKRVSTDQAVLVFDRRQQGVFSKSFESYAAIAVPPQRTSAAERFYARMPRCCCRELSETSECQVQ